MNLQSYLQHIKQMPDHAAELISTYFSSERKSKGTLLIQEGKISRHSYFLQSGVIRCFIIDLEGNEVTTRFYAAPDFLNDYLSFFEQHPGEENYELVTDCVLWSINYEDMQTCFHNIPEFREWGRMLLTLNYTEVNKRMISMHKETALERYQHLIDHHPQIAKEVPLNLIASYSGITKSSLSRIRKELQELS